MLNIISATLVTELSASKMKMSNSNVSLSAVISIIVMYLGSAMTLRITELTVPRLVDPRDTAILSCGFDMAGDELNSVKWYKDDHEFFRFMPRAKPSVRSFPVIGIHLDQQLNPRCGMTKCEVVLTNLNRIESSGSYKCEVSSEAPTFRIASDDANMTVIALPREDPRLDGVQDMYTEGDTIAINCTAAPSDPPASLSFYINDKMASSDMIEMHWDSQPDAIGLIARSMTLRMHVDRHLFTPQLALRCEAIAPPAPPRAISRTLMLRSPDGSPQHLTNQKFEWPSSSGIRLDKSLECILILVGLLNLYFVSGLN